MTTSHDVGTTVPVTDTDQLSLSLHRFTFGFKIEHNFLLVDIMAHRGCAPFPFNPFFTLTNYESFF